MDELTHLSDRMAGIIEAASASVVQVAGRRRPASGIVFRDGLVLTTSGALGRDDRVRVRTGEGAEVAAEVAGWDAATSLVLLSAPGVNAPALAPSPRPPRVGHLAIAIGRSWSNVLTATNGIVSIIGGPLSTGRGRSIDRVIRVSAPMHGGFAGGAVLDASGGVLGVATAAEIRGLGVVIPADLAWTTAASLAEHGTTGRGYLGVAGQAVRLPDRQRGGLTSTQAVLVVGVSEGSPAETGGILLGDVLVAVDGHDVSSPMDLLELLQGHRIGRSVPVRVLRGGEIAELTVTVGRRPSR